MRAETAPSLQPAQHLNCLTNLCVMFGRGSERIVVDEDIRASFRAQLLNSMPHVLGYLSQMDTDGNDKMDLQVRGPLAH